ncbi:MAG: DegQ family serine endoprotease [Magnetospiraceae bacterium]
MRTNNQQSALSRSAVAARSTPSPFHILVTALSVFVIALAMMAAAQAAPAPESFSGLAKKVIPSVVTISTTQASNGGPQAMEEFNLPPGSPFEEFFKDFFEKRQGQGAPHPQRRPTSLGSGFVIDTEGHVVTNNHVIADAAEIRVVLHDGTIIDAELVGTDPETDIAVLKIDPDAAEIPAVKFGNSDQAHVGDWVMAVGNPFGLGSTVTAGIISARGRDINAGRYDDFIQTDASINKGNSGGPLFNLDGDVIGVNTLIFSPSGGNVGIGFAVPSQVAEPIVDQLIQSGQVKRGWLGVRIQLVTDEIAESLKLDSARGALVASVTEGSPAAGGGLKPGDVILTFDGRDVPEMRKLPRIVADTPVGKTVEVEVWRDGKKETASIEVAELKQEYLAAAREEPKSNAPTAKEETLGLTLGALTPELREQFEIDGNIKGVVVIDVDGNGPAAEKDVVPGDVIAEVNQNKVSSPAEVSREIANARAEKRRSVLLMLEAQGGVRFVAVRIDS